MTTRKRKPNAYSRVERGIRRVTYVYDDGTTKEAGFEVRVGQTRLGMHPNITKARSARDKGLADADRGMLVAPSAGDRRVLAVAEMWLAGSQVAELKPSTLLRYTGIVKGRLSPLHDRKVNKVTPAVVDAFKAGLVKEGLSPLTVRKVLFVLSFVMETAKREGMVATNPCTDALRTKRGRAANPRPSPSLRWTRWRSFSIRSPHWTTTRQPSGRCMPRLLPMRVSEPARLQGCACGAWMPCVGR